MLRYTRDGTRMLAAFDYAPDVIQSLKAALPRRTRRWDPESKVWSIDIRWWESACRVFEMYGLMEGLWTPDTAWEALHLRSTAPPRRWRIRCTARWPSCTIPTTAAMRRG